MTFLLTFQKEHNVINFERVSRRMSVFMYLEKGCVKAALCIDRKYAFQLDKSSPSSETSKRVFLHKLYVNKLKMTIILKISYG